MAGNIPGVTNPSPGAYTYVKTQSRGVSIPGGSRIAAIMGEGVTPETIVAQAQGGGKDGLNPSYTSTTGADGRHFQLLNFPLISNRTTIFKNGVPLVGLESAIDSSPFSYLYDYRLDILTGELELQRSHLQDQGGTFYVPLSTNVGQGTLNALALVDQNAPPEIWTIRCISVQRNSMNQPIAGTAKFLAIGSISGSVLDANGNPIIWVANNQVVSNGILSFSIQETQSMSVTISPFREGDGFTVKTISGVLVRNDSLTSTEIPVANINDPQLLQGMSDVVAKHGSPTVSNSLSLGCQLAFANSSPALMTVQCAPAMPRRLSYELDPAVNSLSTNDDDFIFPLPLNVTPEFEDSIHFFVTNNSTNIETQIIPNKLDFYTLGTSGYPTVHSFITDNTPAPGGYSYFYSVIQSLADVASGFDGYLARDPAFTNRGIFSSSISFDATYVGKTLKVIDALNVANSGSFSVTAVSGSDLYVTSPTFGDFTNQTSVTFQVIDVVTGLPVASNTDGTLVKINGTGTGTFNSTAVNFNLISSILTHKIQINGSTNNNGLYDITGYNSGTNTLTIAKAFVSEHNLRFEVLDPSATSDYVVINKNVVPNGYKLRVTLVDTKDANFYDAGWINALASLEKVECDIVVPLPKQTISVIFQNALAHCQTMSNILNRKERVLFCGAIKGLTVDNLTGVKPAAVEDIGVLEGIQGSTVTDVLNGNIEDLANYSVPDSFGGTFRCVYFYPDHITVQAGADNVIIDGFYIAAAAAGYESADVHIENPLTNKVLTGFTLDRTTLLTPSQIQALGAAGVTVLQPVAGGGRIIWGITTSQSGFPEEQEISIVFIRDRVAKIMRQAFAGFVGTAAGVNTISALNTRAVTVLNSLISQNLITKYSSPVVQQDDVDPRQFDVGISVIPVYGINYIFLTIGVGQN